VHTNECTLGADEEKYNIQLSAACGSSFLPRERIGESIWLSLVTILTDRGRYNRMKDAEKKIDCWNGRRTKKYFLFKISKKMKR
jgi:hypothetical protein